jgi:hypothetical protein
MSKSEIELRPIDLMNIPMPSLSEFTGYEEIPSYKPEDDPYNVPTQPPSPVNEEMNEAKELQAPRTDCCDAPELRVERFEWFCRNCGAYGGKIDQVEEEGESEEEFIGIRVSGAPLCCDNPSQHHDGYNWYCGNCEESGPIDPETEDELEPTERDDLALCPQCMHRSVRVDHDRLNWKCEHCEAYGVMNSADKENIEPNPRPSKRQRRN